MTGALHVSGGVFVLLLLATVGGAGVIHSLYRLRRPGWRSDDWWGNRRMVRLALVSAVDTHRAGEHVRHVRRATDVVRALETMLLGTMLMMLAAAAAAGAVA